MRLFRFLLVINAALILFSCKQVMVPLNGDPTQVELTVNIYAGKNTYTVTPAGNPVTVTFSANELSNVSVISVLATAVDKDGGVKYLKLQHNKAFSGGNMVNGTREIVTATPPESSAKPGEMTGIAMIASLDISAEDMDAPSHPDNSSDGTSPSSEGGIITATAKNFYENEVTTQYFKYFWQGKTLTIKPSH